jgi:hypothetical protein
LLLSPSVPLAHAQLLPLHVSPLVHWCPHVPQLLLSPSVPLAHAQLPLLHCVPPVHWCPHVPQLLLSPNVPLAHAQTPPEHCSPLVHVWLHVPQLLLSLDVLTHAVPHSLVVGDPQLMAHEVPLHTACPIPEVGPEQAVHVVLPPQPFDVPGEAHPPGQEMAPGSHVH